jgi:capsular polysaccharide biosynthesis protein/Mrp family chromosome partitioning ATPase
MILRAHLVWILLMTAGVTAGAALYSFSRTSLYTSHADVVVQPRLFSASGQPLAPDMGTEQAVATSGAVVVRAAKALGVAPDALVKSLSVAVPANTHVLRIGATSPVPAEAQVYAGALAAAYVDYWNEQQQAALEASAAKTGTPATAIAKTEIITAAGLPSTPSSPNHLVDLGIAVVVGLAAGVGTAFARDRLDDRLRSLSDLEQRAGAPVIGDLPAMRYRGYDPPARMATLTDPDGDLAAAYRELRTRTQHALMRNDAKILLITSPTPAGHPVVVAANLAVSLAQSGLAVTLVGADPADIQPSALLDVPYEPGLSDVVRDRVALAAALHLCSVAGLAVLPGGWTGGDHGPLLRNGTIGTVLSKLATKADVVIVVAPAMLSGAITGVLAEFADLAVLVVDAARTTRRAVVAAAAQLEPLRPTLIGCVLDNVGRPRKPPLRTPMASEPGHRQLEHEIPKAGENQWRIRLTALSTKGIR